MQVKQKQCKNCKAKFLLQYSTTQQVCSHKCAIELAKKKEAEKAKKQWNKEKRILRKKLETKSDLEKKFQKEINTIIRLLDKGHKCISLDQLLRGKYDAGHLYSVGSNPTIRFNLFNIFGQSVHANQHKGGMPLEYVEGLENTFGTALKEYCLSLKQTPDIKLSKEELRDKIAIAKSIVKWLKLQDRKFTLKERLEYRQKFTEELGIYAPAPQEVINY